MRIPNEDIVPADIEPGADLRDTDLSDAVLTGADLARSTLRGADLQGVTLLDADLRGADLRDTDISDADLRNATCSDAQFRHANLRNSDLRFADLEDTGFVRADLHGANLAGAELTDSALTSANLENAEARGATFRRAIMRRVDCARGGFQHADLRETDCYRAEFCDSDLTSANLQDANLREADLSDVDLGSADLTEADLEAADLPGADLDRAVLARTNCFDTDFAQANFYGAVFADTKINSSTSFAIRTQGEFESDTADGSEHEPLDELVWMHRTVERLSRENALVEQAREAYIDRKDLRRRQYRERALAGVPDPRAITVQPWRRIAPANVTHRVKEGLSRVPGERLVALRKWLGAVIAGGVMRYGERPVRVLTLSALVLLAGTLLYQLPAPENLYVSLVSFVTPVGGAPELRPADEWVRAIESLTGLLLLTVLVFVFGRRSTV